MKQAGPARFGDALKLGTGFPSRDRDWCPGAALVYSHAAEGKDGHRGPERRAGCTGGRPRRSGVSARPECHFPQ